MNLFDALALDETNRPAAMAAQSVAEAHRPPFAPLVVAGTRQGAASELLAAIASGSRQARSEDRITLLGIDALAERQREALLSGRSDELREELASTDLLLIDGLESLPGHAECQGLLADLLDARRSAGRETVIATATNPSAIAGLDPRVLRRLQQGRLVEVAFPRGGARLALLRNRQNGDGPALPEPVLRALADAELPTLRDYFGALSRLLAFQEASPVPLSPEDALLLVGISPEGSEGSERSERSERSVGSDADEFSAFLSEVTGALAGRLDGWRSRVGDAITRWGEKGLRTHTLEALLQEDRAGDPDGALRAFEAAAEAILQLAEEAARLAPDLAGAEVFRDPGQLSAARLLVEEARAALPLSAPLPHFRWEDLVEGPALRLPIRAGREVIREPGNRYSPLVVTGGSGSGKSHFLHGLGNALVARGLGPVVCLSGPALAAEIRSLPDAAAAADWRGRYGWVAGFLLDDLHLLAGELKAQQELAGLLAELGEGKRQAVLASLRPLEQLPDFDPRLMALLQNGLTVELPPPDREVRLAVIRRLLAGDPAGEDAALVDYLASRPADSVRAVQAMVQRVLVAAGTQQSVASPQLARETLEFGLGGLRRPRAGSGGRISGGIPAPGIGLLKSGEKMVKRWPRPAERLIEELR